MSCTVYLATKAASPLNGPAGGGGPSVARGDQL